MIGESKNRYGIMRPPSISKIRDRDLDHDTLYSWIHC